jgi:membrane-associated phospholipid phosphatase
MEITREEIRTASTSRVVMCRMSRRARAAIIALLEACGAFELVALSYLGLSGLLIALFWRNLPRAGRLFTIHAGVIGFVVALLISARRATNSPLGRGWAARFLLWLRDWYPQLVFLFCFEELGSLVHLVRNGWGDTWLLQFDYWLVGVSPAVWFAQHSQPLLTDFMQMAYLSYFFFLTILAITLHRWGPDSPSTGRPRLFSFWAVMTSSMAAYAIGYVISIFLPVESPYYSLAALHLSALHGGPFTKVSDLIEHFGRVHGGAFPSEHVAGSFVALLGAWRYRRRLFWIFLPFFACMCVSTVYVRNHYIADVFAGFATGAIGFWLGHRVMRMAEIIPEQDDARALKPPRATPKFRMGIFENPRDGEQLFFPPSTPNDLKADGQPTFGPSAGQ